MSSQQNSKSKFQEDKVAGSAFDKKLFGRLLSVAAPYRRQMALAIFLILATTGLGVVGPFLIREAIDGPLADSISGATDDAETAASVDWSSLYGLTGVFIVVSVALLVLRFVQFKLMAWIGQKVMVDLRRRVFGHLLNMPFAYFDRHPVGRLVTRITSDIEALNELFASGVVTFIADILVLIAITVALLSVNISLALVTLAALPLLLLATFVFRAKARQFYREQRSHLSHLNAFTQESLQGMSLIQLFRREAKNQSEYQSINARYFWAFIKSVVCFAIYFPAVEIISTITLCVVIWQASTLLTSTPPTITLGDFALFWIFLGRFFMPIRDMADKYNILQSAMAAAERLFQVLDTPQTIRDPDSPREIESIEGALEFDHVSFAYRENEPVLRDVSFQVEPGQTVAVVGATGAGKSTIVSLLSRFYDPQDGSIRIDGIDVRDFRKADLRSKIGIVLQDVFIFSRTIAENVRLGTEGISDADVSRAIERVNANRFTDRLPSGQDYELNERGRALSVGERQLLSFARALVHDPQILVLDEATANVDSETEALIQDALAKLLVGRTSIVIAHRLSTIRQADKIVVLHKGRVREVGTHRALLEENGIYRRLYELQYQDR